MASRLSHSLPVLVPLFLNGCGPNVRELGLGSGLREYCETPSDSTRVCEDPVAKLSALREEFSETARHCGDAKSVVEERKDVWRVATYGSGYDASDWRVMHGTEGCHPALVDNFQDSRGDVWVLPASDSTSIPAKQATADTMLAKEGKN